MDEHQVMFKEGLIGFSEDGSPYLKASRCPKCGKYFFPARDFCTECYNEEMEEAALSRVGRLHVYTVVSIGVKGFPTPYILAWITFPEGPRIVAQVDFDPEQADKLYTDMEMQLEVGCLRVLEDGTEVMGYKFKPLFH